jgi:hypothetical protein
MMKFEIEEKETGIGISVTDAKQDKQKLVDAFHGPSRHGPSRGVSIASCVRGAEMQAFHENLSKLALH